MTLATSDTGEGRPVVLLHGQPGSGASWDPIIGQLSTDHRVLAPDRVGYGLTPGEALDMSGNAELVAALISERSTGPAVIVAHSWAGGVAVLLADRYPERVAGLVLVGAACTSDSVNVLDYVLCLPVVGDILTVCGLVGISAVLPRLRRLISDHETRHRFWDWAATALPDRGVFGGGRGALGRHRRTFMIEQRALLAEMDEVTGALGRLSTPVAVVIGEWDLVVPPHSSVTLQSAIAGATLSVLPRAGHFVARDSPDALMEIVRHLEATMPRPDEPEPEPQIG